MSKYRLRYQLATRQTAGYQGYKARDIRESPEGLAFELELMMALLWLRITHENLAFDWQHVAPCAGPPKSSFASLPCWKGHRLDQIRVLLEEVHPDGTVTVTATSADWDDPDEEASVSFIMEFEDGRMLS